MLWRMGQQMSGQWEWLKASCMLVAMVGELFFAINTGPVWGQQSCQTTQCSTPNIQPVSESNIQKSDKLNPFVIYGGGPFDLPDGYSSDDVDNPYGPLQQWMLEHYSLPPTVFPGVARGDGYGAFALGGPVSARMYGSGNASGLYAGGDVSVTHNSGYRVTDTAGTIIPNSLAPGFHSLNSGGGFNLTADAARLFDLNANQRLLFDLIGDYHHNSTDYGTPRSRREWRMLARSRETSTPLPVPPTIRSNTFYLNGRAAFDWSRADITNNVITAGATGNTDGRGYTLKATVGNLFPLFNTFGIKPTVIVKGPPRAVGGGYALFLDVSGHYAYVNERDDGFTDSTGFVYGREQLSYSDIGARARLLAVIPTNLWFAWMPYVGMTVDRQLGFSHTFDIPNQAVTTADTLNFAQSNTSGAWKRDWTHSFAAAPDSE